MLRVPLFRALWLVALASNIGTWMQNVAAAWLMTTLTASPVDVALVQTATTLPVFLVAIPSGALADLVDRRRLLLVMQTWMCLSAAVLGVLTLGGTVTPWSLLAFTFTLGLGAAMSAPAWQALIPEIVPRQQLPSALALNSAGLSIARAVGPALGGLVVAAIGAGGGFLLNAASFLGVIVFVFRWRPPPRSRTAPEEHLLGAMRAGTRYARYDPALRVVLVRSGAALLFAAAIWALLPLLARDRLALGSLGYGALLGCFGAGAVIGATVRPALGRRFGVDAIVNGATLLFAAVMALSALTSSVMIASPMFVAAGVAWTGLVSSFTTVAQLAAPGWARARALAAYLLVSQGGLAAGSALWGLLAQRTTIETALLMASAGLAATPFLTRRFALSRGESVDLTPSLLPWPEPQLAVTPDPEDGPVLVTIRYRIPPDAVDGFVHVMDEVRQMRFRDGARAWGLYQDLADEMTFVEHFVVDSWAEHLRQHARVTVDDHELGQRARSFHQGPAPPAVSHLIAAAARASAPH